MATTTSTNKKKPKRGRKSASDIDEEEAEAEMKREMSELDKEEAKEESELVSDEKELVQCIHCPIAMHMECCENKPEVLRLSKTSLICRRHLSDNSMVNSAKKPMLKLARDVEILEVVKKKKTVKSTVPEEIEVETEEAKECVLCHPVKLEDYPVNDEAIVEGDFLDELVRVGTKHVFIHSNCALRSPEVYIDASGVLCNLQKAIKRGKLLNCTGCKQRGATIGCHVPTCKRNYHLRCAYFHGGVFLDNGDGDPHSFFCKVHASGNITLASREIIAEVDSIEVEKLVGDVTLPVTTKRKRDEKTLTYAKEKTLNGDCSVVTNGLVDGNTEEEGNTSLENATHKRTKTNAAVKNGNSSVVRSTPQPTRSSTRRVSRS